MVAKMSANNNVVDSLSFRGFFFSYLDVLGAERAKKKRAEYEKMKKKTVGNAMQNIKSEVMMFSFRAIHWRWRNPKHTNPRNVISTIKWSKTQTVMK